MIWNSITPYADSDSSCDHEECLEHVCPDDSWEAPEDGEEAAHAQEDDDGDVHCGRTLWVSFQCSSDEQLTSEQVSLKLMGPIIR